MPQAALPWWNGRTLHVQHDSLRIGSACVESLAREHGTPLYVYHGAQVTDRVNAMHAALAQHGLPSRIYYALKANRFAPLVALLRSQGDVGIDACSPREIAYALDAGFSPAEISVTASCLSTRDLSYVSQSGCHLNLDTTSAIERYAALQPAERRIGLRVDTGIETGYGVNQKTSYARGKLGMMPEDFDAALLGASAHGLTVDTVHTHLGWGLRASDDALIARAFALVAELAERVPALTTINVGGGLGGRLVADDAPLGLERWAQLVADAFGHLKVTIACEPGTFLVAEAGALVVEVASVWQKRGVQWAGIDANFGTNLYAAHYGLPHEIIAARSPLGDAAHEYSIAGNVNESGDVFARDRALPALDAGDLLVLYPAGAYGSSMSSDHCLRGNFTEVLA
ncbi:MAG: hypothetical protein JWO05_2879 [Gemmatimonadetes bacterium]|nr:hypothetical protein [Gemmatimonadota bacterium]